MSPRSPALADGFFTTSTTSALTSDFVLIRCGAPRLHAVWHPDIMYPAGAFDLILSGRRFALSLFSLTP